MHVLHKVDVSWNTLALALIEAEQGEDVERKNGTHLSQHTSFMKSAFEIGDGFRSNLAIHCEGCKLAFDAFLSESWCTLVSTGTLGISPQTSSAERAAERAVERQQRSALTAGTLTAWPQHFSRIQVSS